MFVFVFAFLFCLFCLFCLKYAKAFKYRKLIHSSPIIHSLLFSHEMRKKRILAVFFFFLIIIILLFFLLLGYYLFFPYFSYFVLFSFFFFVLFSFFYYRFVFPFWLSTSTSISLKEEFFRILNLEIQKDISYNPDRGLTMKEYKDAGFQLYDVFKSEDYMEGSFFNTSYRMSEVHTFLNKKGFLVPKFQGLVAMIPLDMPDDFFLSIGDSELHLFKNILIVTGNSRFDKKYDILSNNEDLTLQFLTDDVIEKILDFSHKTKIKFEIKLCNQYLYIRFFTGDLFEMPHSLFFLSYHFLLWENVILQVEKIMEYLRGVFVS